MSDKDQETFACPSCGEAASGNFCEHCGTPLGGKFCNMCGAAMSEEARFCNQCGAPRVGGVEGGGTAGAAAAATSGASGRSPSTRAAGAASGTPRRGAQAARAARDGQSSVASQTLPWWIAGASMFALIFWVGWTMVRPAETPPTPQAPFAGTGAGALGAPAPDISNLTPRQAADRLFDRVLRTLSAGDTAGALAFQPMGVQAYVRAEPLDLDGIYHRGALEILADPQAARASAERILEEDGDHVLALGLAASAALAQGDSAGAADYYDRLLEVFPQERADSLPKYDGHVQMLDVYRADAAAFEGSR